MLAKMCMTFREILRKRLARKYDQLREIENTINSADDLVNTAAVKRKFVELKSSIAELENCIDLADTMLSDDDSREKRMKIKRKPDENLPTKIHLQTRL